METELTKNEILHRERSKKEWDKYTESIYKGVGGYVEINANKIPDKTSLMFEDKSWTWDGLNRESNKYANFFLKLGIKYDDVVAIVMENHPDYLFSTTGINKTQGIGSLINVNLRRQGLEHVLKQSNPKYIIVDGENLPNILEIEEKVEIPKKRILVVNNYQNIKHNFTDLNNELNNENDINPPTTKKSLSEQICTYLFSSGTTGFPKAIIISNAKMMGVGIHGYNVLQLTQNETLYIPTPLYHGLGFQVGWFGAVWGGATTAIRKTFSSSNYWQDIWKFKATCTVYIGEISRYLLNMPENEYEKKSALKRMIGLGLRKNIWTKFKERFNIEHIYEYYGSTEVGGYINLDNEPGMVGRLNSPSVILGKYNRETGEFYKDQNGFCIPCNPGDEGIALADLKLDTQFMGYKFQEQTEKKLLRNVFEKDDLYFYTGDLLKLHENNWVSFVDRLGNTFRWKGENVSTTEVENVLNSYNSIEGSNVFGVEIPSHEGKVGMASIKLDNETNFDLHEFLNYISNELPKFAIPVFIRIQSDRLETTGNFKLRKGNLQKEAFDINRISDKLYVLLPGKDNYTELTEEIYNSIENNKVMF